MCSVFCIFSVCACKRHLILYLLTQCFCACVYFHGLTCSRCSLSLQKRFPDRCCGWSGMTLAGQAAPGTRPLDFCRKLCGSQLQMTLSTFTFSFLFFFKHLSLVNVHVSTMICLFSSGNSSKSSSTMDHRNIHESS